MTFTARYDSAKRKLVASRSDSIVLEAPVDAERAGVVALYCKRVEARQGNSVRAVATILGRRRCRRTPPEMAPCCGSVKTSVEFQPNEFILRFVKTHANARLDQLAEGTLLSHLTIQLPLPAHIRPLSPDSADMIAGRCPAWSPTPALQSTTHPALSSLEPRRPVPLRSSSSTKSG